MLKRADITRRLAAAAPELTPAGTPVRLRPVQAADEGLLLNWQWQAGARLHSRNPTPPTAEDHAVWFAKRLADPACCAMIILAEGEPAGTLRLDHRGDDRWEVSVLVALASRGQGIATAALHVANRLASELEFVAEIDSENTASLKAFAKASFKPCGAHWYVRGSAARRER